MVDSEGRAGGPFGRRVEFLGPDAVESVTIRQEEQGRAVGRDVHEVVAGIVGGDGDQIALAEGRSGRIGIT